MFVSKYPYTDIHELNLDWLLGQMLQLRTDMKDFINQNVIKYADPIQWNITTQYESNTVVIEPNSGNAYISSQPVPAGVAISNTDYWSVIGNFSVLYESIKESIAAADDGSNINATEARTEGQLLWLNSKLYKVLSDISVGALYITSGTGQNLQEVTIEELLNKETADRIEAVENLGNVLMSSIMSIQGNIPKDVNLIKPETFGAVGDGVTDDTQALQDCVDYANTNHKIVYLNNSYKVTTPIYLYDGLHIIGGNSCNILYDYNTDDRQDGYIFNTTNHENIVIEGVTFTGTGARTDGYNICMCIGGKNSNNIIITHCNFYNSPDMSCIFFDDSNHIYITYCNINNYTYAGIMLGEGTSNSKVLYCKITNGKITTGGDRYAISLSGYYTPTPGAGVYRKLAVNLECAYCYIKDEEPYWEGIDSHGGDQIYVHDNTVIDCAQAIAIFTDNTRKFYASNAYIYNNRIGCTESKINAGSLYAYICAFGGSNFKIYDNDIYTNALTSNSKYEGISIRGSNIDFIRNILNGVSKKQYIAFASDEDIVNPVIKDNIFTASSAYSGANAFKCIQQTSAAINIYARIEGNRFSGFNDLIALDNTRTNSNTYLRLLDNIYLTTSSITTTGTFPDIATQATISSCQGEAGKKVRNISPTANGFGAWFYISGAWKGTDAIQA